MDRCGNERSGNDDAVEQEEENISARQQERASRRKRFAQSFDGAVHADTQPYRENHDCWCVQSSGERQREKRADHQSVARNLEVAFHRIEILRVPSAFGASAAADIWTSA